MDTSKNDVKRNRVMVVRSFGRSGAIQTGIVDLPSQRLPERDISPGSRT